MSEAPCPDADIPAPSRPPGVAAFPARRLLDRSDYGRAVLIVVATTILCGAVFSFFAAPTVGMLYLLAVAVVAARYGRGPAAVASVLSVAAFDYFFVEPYFAFGVEDPHILVRFAAMLVIALLLGRLTAHIRDQSIAARRREHSTQALYRLTRELAAEDGLDALLAAALRNVNEVFGAQAVLFLPGADGRLQCRVPSGGGLAPPGDLEVAQRVFDHRRFAEPVGEASAGRAALYLPMLTARGAVGVLGLRDAATDDLLSSPRRQLLDTFVSQIALAVEHQQATQRAHESQVQAETERLRNALLSSVSHDLRTPLAIIGAASDGLLDSLPPDKTTQRDLVQTIHEESQRLSRFVGNLLEMTRLESGAIQVNRQWYPLEEIVGSAINRLNGRLSGHAIRASLPPDLPLVPVDGVLIEQVFINLLENAGKYAPTGTGIEIDAAAAPGGVTVCVADHGAGVPPDETARIFEKFHRGAGAGPQRGVGLGLSICRAIVEAHGGRVWVENRPAPGHGAVFRFTLPIVGTPPVVPELAEEPEVAAQDPGGET